MEAQYYAEQLVVNKKKVIDATKNFLMEIERISDGLNQQEIEALIHEAKQDRQ